MKMKIIPVLAVLATLAGCAVPMTDSDETIGEVGQAFVWQAPPPVGYWSFNDCSENVVLNQGELSLPATLYNGASCGPSTFGSAGIFDGIDDRAEIAYNSALDFTNQMTVSAWVKPNGTSAPQTIAGKWYAPDSYMLWLSNGSYRFSVALAGGGWFSVATPATAGVFSHVTGVFDGANLNIYVGANLMAQTSAVGTLQASARSVTIGNHPTWNPFAGAIDEVQLYNVALSAEQIGGVHMWTCTGCSGDHCCDPYGH